MANTIDDKVEDENNGVPMGRFGRITQRRGSSSGGDTRNNQNNQDNSDDKHSGFSNFRRGAGCFLLGAYLVGSALGLWGYTKSFAAESNEKKWVVNSETAFKNMYNPQVRDDKIIFSGQTAPYGLDDIFIMNKDGTGLKNLTNTPDKWELYPFWSDEGPLGTNVGIVYKECSNIEIRGVNPDNRDFGLGREPTIKCYFIDIEGKNKRQISEDIFKLYIKE